MRITQTNGNSQNNIKGSRLSIYTDCGYLVDRFVVPSRNAKAYCERHMDGRYYERLQKAKYQADMADRYGLACIK